MQDLYRGFKKVSEDENGAVLEHEQGHRLTISKSGLSKKHLKSLSKLPLHQADGTNPDPNEEERRPLPEMDMGDEAKQLGKEVVGNVAEKMLEGARELAGAPEPDLKSSLQQWSQEQSGQPQESQQAPQSFAEKLSGKVSLEQQLGAHEMPPQVAMAPTEPVVGGLSTMVPVQEAEPEKAGLVEQKGLAPDIRGLAETPAEQQPPPSKIPAPAPVPTAVPKYESLMDVAADPNQPESVRIEALNQEQIRLLKDYNSTLDQWRQMMSNKPDNEKATAFSNRSTWGKIGVAIGLLMGGMSAGITGKPNPVLELLNKELEEETHRQKNASEKEMNLYKMNLQMLGDTRQAYLQTINQLRELSQLKADEVLGKSGVNPSSQMAAQAIFAENQAKIAKANTERAQLTMAQVMKAKQRAGIPGEIPDVDDPWIERAVRIKMPGNQIVKRYVKDKSMLKEAQEDFSQIRRVQDIISAINNFNTKTGYAPNIPMTEYADLHAKAQNLNQQAQTEIAKLMSGRLGQLRPGLLEKFPDLTPLAGVAPTRRGEETAKATETLKMIDELRQQLIDQYLVQ